MKKLLLSVILFVSLNYIACAKISNEEKVDIKILNSDYKDSLFTGNNLEDGWKKINIENIGSINLPPEMEIQDGDYKEIHDKEFEIMGFSTNNIIFQQKGLNDFLEDSFNNYARVMIKTIISTPNSYDYLTDKFDATKSELEEFDNLAKNEISEKIKIVKWYPSEIILLNNMYGVLTTYDRQISNNPVVYVMMYQFQNNDRLHSITMSYRKEESEQWSTIFEKIIKSLNITEKK